MKDNKQRLLQISVMTVKVVLGVVFVFCAFVFIYYGVINRGDIPGTDPVKFVTDWDISGEGEEYMQFVSTLPENIKDNEYFFFYTRKDVTVYIDGEFRKDFVEDRDVNIPGGSLKKFYLLVPLVSSDSGAEVKLVRKAKWEDEMVVPESFVSTRFGGFTYLMATSGPSLILAMIVLIFSFVVIIVSFVLRYVYKMHINMMYGAIGIFVIAGWIVTDSFLFPFVFGVYHVNDILNYMICLIMPIAPIVYMNSIQHGRYKVAMSVLMLLSALNVIIWPLLHFTGIFPFYNARNIVNVILVFMSGMEICVLIIDAIRGRAREYRYTFIGFFGFLLCCVTELLIVLMVTTTNEALPMVAGLAFLLVFVVVQQISDIRKINAEKQHAIDISDAKTRFLASMSHEIRTPINAILGMNEMILRENEDETIEEYSENIKTSGKMLLMLINDVLDFSKIEAGKLEIHDARFLMSEMLYDVISLVKERSDEKGLALEVKIENEIPNEIVSDEFRIRQILINFINNAVKYTDEGTVSLILGGSYTDDGYELKMVVKDTGKGIRKEDQENLFEAFSRADIKSNVNIEGTGLGLAIVKSIVDSMNGNIGVISEYGEGSQFWVKLPVKYLDKTPLKNDFMENRSKNDPKGDTKSFMAPDAKILAVDDNESNLKIVRLFLKRTGITPDLCSSGTKAIELCKEKKYDLILLDHMMPDPDGIETMHIIRSDEASLNKETKAVVLTANAVAGSRKMYLAEGFDDYLAKPLDSKVFEQMVKKMLPEELVKEPASHSGKPVATAGRSEVAAGGDVEDASSLRSRLSRIDGFDYETAMLYCGDEEEFLLEIINDVTTDCLPRAEKMRKNLADNDIKSYAIEAHSIKSSMATIGLSYFSERAKEHEFAAKGGDLAFIEKDAEAFINEYMEICKKLENAVIN